MKAKERAIKLFSNR